MPIRIDEAESVIRKAWDGAKLMRERNKRSWEKEPSFCVPIGFGLARMTPEWTSCGGAIEFYVDNHNAVIGTLMLHPRCWLIVEVEHPAI